MSEDLSLLDPETVAEHIKTVAKKQKVSPIDVDWTMFRSYFSVDNATSARIKAIGGFSDIKTAFFGTGKREEAYKVKAMAKEVRKVEKLQNDEKLIYDAIAENISKNFAKPIYKLPKLPTRAKYLERHSHLVISDTHFGSDLDPSTGVRRYGPAEESRSMAAITMGTLDFKTQYRENTKLYVNLLGDIIQGKIHDPYSSADIAEQINRAIYVLGESLFILASQFPEVEVNCATGNHDRIPYVHKERAMSDKNNSYASVIYYALKRQLSQLPNVKFNIPMTPYFTYNSFGANYWCTHGDTQIRIPNPMGSINVGSLENEVNKLNARQGGERYSVVVVGHIHTGMKISLKNGVTLITNPPLIPTDQYAQSLNIDPDSPTGQQLFESVPGFACGDSRTLWVTESDRQNQSLDKIISPFKGI